MKYTATIYGSNIEANTLSYLKRKASIISNGRRNPFDSMIVGVNSGGAVQHFTMYRTNRKTPWGEFAPGKWS